MSLLTIIQDASSALGFEPPASFTSTGRRNREMLSLLNLGGMQLASMKNTWGGGWNHLTREYEFNTIAGESRYALPEDFFWLIEDSAWDRESYWGLRGSLGPQEWQRERSGLTRELTLRQRFRIQYVGNTRSIILEPEPVAVETIVFEYGSRHWVANSTATERRTRFEEGSDVSYLDEDLHVLDLIWRHRRLTGITYDHEFAEFTRESRKRMSLDSNAPVIRPGRWDYSDEPPWPVVPETGYGGYS